MTDLLTTAERDLCTLTQKPLHRSRLCLKETSALVGTPFYSFFEKQAKWPRSTPG